MNKPLVFNYKEHKDDNGTCVWADVQSDMTESPNDVIKKPRTVRYKLHKPIEYVSIEFDEEEDVSGIAHYNEVVYCKDCRHRNLFSCPLADNDFQKDEDFCSWGERREE